MKKFTFLVVDDNPEGRYLVSKTLMRSFPRSFILECVEADAAFTALMQKPIAVAVVHRAVDEDGVRVVAKLHAAAPGLPIIYVSGDPRREPAALAAGASKFLDFDKWRLIGRMAQTLLLPNPSWSELDIGADEGLPEPAV